MNDLRDWIVFDLDGTLTDCSHRVHMAQAGLWDEFNAGCRDDKMRPETVAAFRTLNEKYHTMFLTGRDERYKKLTLDLLAEHNIQPDVLKMRPPFDPRPDAEIKVALLEAFFGSKTGVLNAVLFCLDDRDKVVEELRNYGLTVWQVRQGDY